MRKVFSVVALSLFLSSSSYAQEEKITLAISDFQNNTGVFSVSDLRLTIPEMLKTELSMFENLSVLERSKIQAVLAEQALSQTGIIDTEKAQMVGRLIGAEFVLTGEIGYMDRRMRIDAHIVRVETGEVFAEKVTGPDGDAVESMVRILANNINHNLSGNGRHVQQMAISNYYAPLVLAVGTCSAVGAIRLNTSYRKYYDDYENTEYLSEFDNYYDKANRHYKWRNVMIGTTAALLTTGIYLWFKGKSRSNRIYAASGANTRREIRMSAFFQHRPDAIGLKVSLSR